MNQGKRINACALQRLAFVVLLMSCSILISNLVLVWYVHYHAQNQFLHLDDYDVMLIDAEHFAQQAAQTKAAWAHAAPPGVWETAVQPFYKPREVSLITVLRLKQLEIP